MRKILIVDDNEANREILRFRLEKLGHQVIEAVDGEEGLICAQTQTPELIFLDVMMPKLDGWQLCRTLKNNPETQTIPVVMLTALQENLQEFQAHGSSANDYMSKPWMPEHLKAVVEKWLSA